MPSSQKQSIIIDLMQIFCWNEIFCNPGYNAFGSKLNLKECSNIHLYIRNSLALL